VRKYKSIDRVDILRIVGSWLGQLEPCQAAKQFRVALSHGPFPPHEFLEPLELSKPERGLEIGHAVVPAQLFMHKTARWLKTEVAQRPATVCELLIIGDYHAAFARGHELVWVEAERAQFTERTAWPAAVRLAMHLCGVLNDGKPVALGQLHDRVHVNW